ncbi:ATP-dependent Clp protease adaptor ClpS [Haloferula rosea]|uniref:ATP-dependent Clp protease adaptor ClpS n=1 Tax=Haloferula rosea TaxID=490093 RepID=A0A934VGT2_9BACT|nr:ATP-dependent Clp protease adaptor ClpS [Haloferula rosea]MBK1827915.1 ATP-dependent Clp protease adaptor ClpS [Haloferula rosea]
MSESETLLQDSTALDQPWQVVVYDDPVNLQTYVTMVFMKVLGYGRPRAEELMLEVHQLGRSVVWTGGRERAELYTQQLQSHQLQTAMEKAGS